MYNLGYDDVVDSNSLDALFVTANQEMIVTPSDDTIFTPSDDVVTSPSDDVNNPKTGDGSYFGIFLIILLGNVGLFLFIYKRQEIKL